MHLEISPDELGLRKNMFRIPFSPAIVQGPFVSLQQPVSSLESSLSGHGGPSEEVQDREGVS